MIQICPGLEKHAKGASEGPWLCQVLAALRLKLRPALGVRPAESLVCTWDQKPGLHSENILLKSRSALKASLVWIWGVQQEVLEPKVCLNWAGQQWIPQHVRLLAHLHIPIVVELDGQHVFQVASQPRCHAQSWQCRRPHALKVKCAHERRDQACTRIAGREMCHTPLCPWCRPGGCSTASSCELERQGARTLRGRAFGGEVLGVGICSYLKCTWRKCPPDAWG